MRLQKDQGYANAVIAEKEIVVTTPWAIGATGRNPLK
jgi:hypothetical protein